MAVNEQSHWPCTIVFLTGLVHYWQRRTSWRNRNKTELWCCYKVLNIELNSKVVIHKIDWCICIKSLIAIYQDKQFHVVGLWHSSVTLLKKVFMENILNVTLFVFFNIKLILLCHDEITAAAFPTKPQSHYPDQPTFDLPPGDQCRHPWVHWETSTS